MRAIQEGRLVFCVFLLAAVISGCIPKPVVQAAPNPDTERKPVVTGSKKILIFFDGTANEWDTRTNVRRLFELVSAHEDPTLLSLYVDGVGSSSFLLTGTTLGYGLKPRILEGYKFLARYFRKGDQIYIFGFSRGAHQARALAGLLAYNGIPQVGTGKAELKDAAEKIWAFSRHQYDDSAEKWMSWTPDQAAPFAKEIKETFNIETVVAPVQFLGVWDTVPGSQFKKFCDCSEAPDSAKGIRYKILSYPTIREIAHAVSIDEKRSEFSPVFVCPPINPGRTVVHQTWFAGAHADVGGGYGDSNDLAGVSLNWMLELLEKHDLFNGNKPRVYASAAGLAHASICDFPANLGSDYEDRAIPPGAVLHASVKSRMQNGEVPLRKNGKIIYKPYNGNAKTSTSEKRDYCRVP